MPLAVGAGVEFCYSSSDSFMALNEEATKDLASSSHGALAVTEKRHVLLTPAQTSAQVSVSGTWARKFGIACSSKRAKKA